MIRVDEMRDAFQMGVEERLRGKREGELVAVSGEMREEEASDLAEDVGRVIEARRNRTPMPEDRPAVEREDPEPVDEHHTGIFFQQIDADVDFLDVELRKIPLQFLPGAAVGPGKTSAFDEADLQARARLVRSPGGFLSPGQAQSLGGAEFDAGEGLAILLF